jgi:ribonuclease Z
LSKKSFIKFIGTGSGKTSLNRFHSSILISASGYNLLIDAGDGISRAFLSQNISFNSINGIFFTHLHPDHFSGFTFLIVQMKMSGRTKNLDVFVHKSLRKTAEDFLYRSYIFYKKLDFKIRYKEFVDEKEMRINQGFSFIPRQNSHLDKYFRYAKREKISFSCSSVLFKIGGTNIFYSGDIGSAKDLLLFEKNKIDIMISEFSHLNTKEILSVYKRIKPCEFFLTHISDENEMSLGALKKMIAAKDGAKFII